MRRLVAFLVVLTPGLGWAQTGGFELVPTLGFRRGGEIRIQERALKHQDFDVKLTSGGAYGLRVGVPLREKLHLELMANRQEAQLRDEQGLFGETPGGFVPPGSRRILDLDVTYLHAGLVYHWPGDMAHPFAVVSAGMTHFSPKSPLPSDRRFSASAGGGIQLELTERFALKFEGRYYWTDTDEDLAQVQQLEHRDCTGECTYTWRYPNRFTQGEVSVGFVFRP